MRVYFDTNGFVDWIRWWLGLDDRNMPVVMYVIMILLLPFVIPFAAIYNFKKE